MAMKHGYAKTFSNINDEVNIALQNEIRLREKFSKERREIEVESRSGSGVSHWKSFPLYENIKFLNRHVKRRKTITNISRNIRENKENVPSKSSTLLNWERNFEENSPHSSVLHLSPTSSSNLSQSSTLHLSSTSSNNLPQSSVLQHLSPTSSNILPKSSVLQHLSPTSSNILPQSSTLQHLMSPTSPSMQQKCYTPVQKNHLTSKKRRSESDDIEKSLLSLSNTITDKIQNYDKDIKSDIKKDEKENSEDKFLDLIAAEIKKLLENERDLFSKKT
ncbi:uncharacterized protein LOC118646136 [Monomorium pharaonis]|uniref:uncharacterized protein LOC118646136 n=1 Tax=Monomorium pharaonis TaxID=307658 RepID=UPI0017470DFA|nr:uncharacterized protein LOC118646136 [Monomorium pharaonis]